MLEEYIPLIDLSPIIEYGVHAPESAATVASIHQACQTVGFISVKNHGIPTETIISIAKRAK